MSEILKKLEAENNRLLKIAKTKREDEQMAEKQSRELKASTDLWRAKSNVLKQKFAGQEARIAELAKIQAGTEKALFEKEKIRISRELDAKAAQEARLLEKIQVLETRYAEKEVEIKATDVELEKLTKQCAEFDDAIKQAKNELDKKTGMVERLTAMVKKMEVILQERENEQASLEKELKQEKALRVKAQNHAEHLEEIFVALEKKINNLS